MLKSGVDIREFSDLEQHDFVEFSRQETLATFAANSLGMRAAQPGADVKELVNALADLTFPGESGIRGEKSAKMAEQLKEVTAKTYNISRVGGGGRLEIVDED